MSRKPRRQKPSRRDITIHRRTPPGASPGQVIADPSQPKPTIQVLAFDQDDNAPARALGKALGWDQGNPPMDLENNLFGHYTLARRI